MIETELCAYSLASCDVARRTGVTRVELCASPWEGGTTPSAAAIRMARDLGDFELSVMIRPRGGDFLYTDLEFGQMLEDVRFARSVGVDGVVFGVLTADGQVDAVRCAALVAEAGPMAVTFHRAFDMARDLDEALDALIAARCRRVLTSGGAPTAVEGAANLQRLTARAAGCIGIMAGSGVNDGNARQLAALGVDALHFSARCLRASNMRWRNESISMGGIPGVREYASVEADEMLVCQIMTELQR